MNKFEILCVTMNQKDFSKIEEMNIHSNVVFANQCECTAYDELAFEGCIAKMISTQTRGVGINRNLSLSYASAEICLLADDDVVYNDDMEKKVLAEFDKYPDADIIIFHFDTDDKLRQQVKYSKTKRWSKLRGIPWGGFRIAFRLKSIRRANIWFTALFGGGTIFPSGEDSKFLIELCREGLTLYVSKETIGTVSFETSTWFTGRDEKYFYGKGAFYKSIHPRTVYLWTVYCALNITKSNLSFLQKLRWMKNGVFGYKKMLSFDDYKNTYTK